MSVEQPIAARIEALHAWYCSNVLQMRLTPPVERLWYDWIKKGYTGQDLQTVIRYLRREILANKRNRGCLSLGNLLGISPDGIDRFDTDLGLARAVYNVDAKFSPLPPGEAPARPRPQANRTAAAPAPARGDILTPEQLKSRMAELAELKRTLTHDAVETT